MEYNPLSIAIYGVGLLGGSIGAGLKASGYTGKIIGLSSPASIDAARTLGIIDEGHGYDALETVAGRVDCMFLCTPITVIMKTLKALGEMRLPQGLVISDVGSTKSEIVACALAALPESVVFIGGHPMAGSEKSGVAACDPFLFQNAMYLLTPHAGALGPSSVEFGAFLEKFLGCRSAIVAPDEHDAIVASVSHVPHLLAVALVNLARLTEEAHPETLKMAAGGFRDMTRIASAPFSMWRDIFKTNKNAIRPLLDAYIDILRTMQTELASDGLQGRFEEAARTRREIPSANKGFMHPQTDILVVAKDQPGIIAELSAALAGKRINIKDIEVLKVREGEAGTIRMAFESKETARSAVAVLSAVGFTARERD
jgi:prephenate dehydrogenase